MGMSSPTVDRSIASKRKADDSFNIEGMVLPLLKPIITTRLAPSIKISSAHERQQDDFLQDIVEVTMENELLAKGGEDGCETPKSEEHTIPKVLECPPAPRKPRPKRKTRTSSLPERFFLFPLDLDSVFLVYRMTPLGKKLHWPKRIPPFAIEQNGGHHK